MYITDEVSVGTKRMVNVFSGKVMTDCIDIFIIEGQTKVIVVRGRSWLRGLRSIKVTVKNIKGVQSIFVEIALNYGKIVEINKKVGLRSLMQNIVS